MVISVVGSGGKTTLIHKLADEYRSMGKRVFVTTSTHMYIEEDTILSCDADEIIKSLEETGYAMAGSKDGEKITALPYEIYLKVCDFADIVLVEADGAKKKPVKYPDDTEPVIYDNTDEIVVVCSLMALGKTFEESAFRFELVQRCLQVDAKDMILPCHIQRLIREGYISRMKEEFPDKNVKKHVVCDGTLYQRALASLIEADMDVEILKEEWFEGKPTLFICGAGHVAKEVADFAGKLDFVVKVMDDREEFACRERFADVDEVICDDFGNLENYLEDNAYYVVVTRGHRDDYECVNTILKTKYNYLGMIGSKQKVAKTFEMLSCSLKSQGRSDEILQTIHAPIGLPIGAANPGEIAISILAEIIQEKNKRQISSASSQLLEAKWHGILCVIIDKTGSSPRGVGSMMLVGENEVIDSIGGGILEATVIEDARNCKAVMIKDYQLDNEKGRQLGMICGGDNRVLFILV